MKSYDENQTWTLTDLPKNAKTIKDRWVFNMKNDPNGGKKYKARFVAKGYTQKYGIDYQETYSSVLASTSLRILICIAVNKNWKIYQKRLQNSISPRSNLNPHIHRTA